MMDYHTHHVGSQGGYLCAVCREDWDRVAAACPPMIPCFGVHPWHAKDAPVAQTAYDLDEYLSRYPKAQVGESGLDATVGRHSAMSAWRTCTAPELGDYCWNGSETGRKRGPCRVCCCTHGMARTNSLGISLRLVQSFLSGYENFPIPKPRNDMRASRRTGCTRSRMTSPRIFPRQWHYSVRCAGI